MEESKIYGVDCNVTNCVYNKNSNECVAGKIKVSHSCAKPDDCDETLCQTFEKR